MRGLQRLVIAAACASLAIWLTSGVIRADTAPVRLSDVLTVDEVATAPRLVRDQQPFVLSARVTNHGQIELRDLQWFPSVAIDRTQGGDHPRMDILARSPRRLDLAPGDEARISLTFRVTAIGTRQYGLMLELPDRSSGVVFKSDPVSSTTQPDSVAYAIRRALLVGIPCVALLAILIVVVVRSARTRRALMAQIAPHLAVRDYVALAAAALALLAVLNLNRLVGAVGEAGVVSPRMLSWTIYAFIPLRWLAPPIVSCALARGRVPALLVVALFGATFAQANVFLVGQVPMDKLLQLWSPAIYLVVLCLTVRHARRTQFAPALALIALLCYGAAALPWLQLYLNTVVLPAVRG